MPKLDLKKLKSEKPEVRYGTAKQALEMSVKDPAKLYDKLDVFTKLLKGDNRVLKWTATLVIGNLARADDKNRIDHLIPQLRAFVRGKELITAANAIKALGAVAQAKPKYRDAIVKEFLRVERAHYYLRGERSPECRNIALGTAILAMGGFQKDLRGRSDVVAFLVRQTKNTRPATARKAKVLLKKLS